MKLGGAFVIGFVLWGAGVAAAQPAPQPYPPQPYPQPYPPQPYPYPYYPPPAPAPAPAPAPPAKKPAPGVAVFFHALCPDNTQPKCDGGMWFGVRATKIVGKPDTPIGMALDYKAGFGFGFGWEVRSDIAPGERDSMAHVLATAEAGIGPGVRAGPIDILPVLGIGGDMVAWGSTKVDDDPYSEAFWYGHLGLQVRLDGYSLLAAGARKFRGRGLDRVYEDRVEAGVAFVTDKEPISLSVWYSQYEHHLMAGLAFGVGPEDLATRQAPPVKAPE